MEIKIESHDRELPVDLFGGVSPSNAPLSLSEGVSVEYAGTHVRKALGFAEITAFIVTVASQIPPAVAAELVKDWLWPKIRGRFEKITFDQTEYSKTDIELDAKGRIRRITTEKLTRERKSS